MTSSWLGGGSVRAWTNQRGVLGSRDQLSTNHSSPVGGEGPVAGEPHAGRHAVIVVAAVPSHSIASSVPTRHYFRNNYYVYFIISDRCYTYGHSSSVTCPKSWMYENASWAMEPMQPPTPPQWRVLGVQAVTCWVDRIGSSPEVRELESSRTFYTTQMPKMCLDWGPSPNKFC